VIVGGLVLSTLQVLPEQNEAGVEADEASANNVIRPAGETIQVVSRGRGASYYHWIESGPPLEPPAPCYEAEYHEFMEAEGAVPAVQATLGVEIHALQDATVIITGLAVQVHNRKASSGGTMYTCGYGGNPDPNFYAQVDLDKRIPRAKLSYLNQSVEVLRLLLCVRLPFA
jgi:hypothetical protein